MTTPINRALRGGPVQPTSAALRPLGPDEVRIVGGFWGEKQQLNADAILGHCESWMERIGWIGNFDRAAAGTIGADTVGEVFVDSEIYKLLEGMAWELGREENSELEARYAALVARVAAAQEPDGYLDTRFGRPGQRPRWSDLEWGHELYCAGHLIQAAVARLRSGHDDELPAVARRLADHLVEVFGPEGRVAVCGHPEIETALVEFSRATGESKYLELARLFIERRGTGTLGQVHFGQEYFQDDLPVRDATVLRGHAVRALYLSSGALDVAVETNDSDLAAAVETQYANTVARRTYLTGGMGSHHLDEAFGADYELPPDRAYAETCAGIASVMLSWRLLLQTGEVKYADLIERTLLNTVLASPREDGHAFYYTNTLHQRTNGTVPNETELSARAESSLRAPWFGVSCCPTNISRTLASVGLYFATATDAGVQLHQYGDVDIDTTLASGRFAARVRTGYPFEGSVAITIDDAPAATTELTLRIPAWSLGTAVLTVNGESVEAEAASVTISREFRTGDAVLLELAMEPRIVHPHPSIDAVRGTVAIERGPLVLCLESVDVPDGSGVDDEYLDASAPLIPTAHGARATVVGRTPAEAAWPYAAAQPQGVPGAQRTASVELVPYFTWANRGPSTMRVWLPLA